MKDKKGLFLIFLLLMVVINSSSVNASENTLGVDKVTECITRMNDLGILSYGAEYKDFEVSRGVFSKAIVVTSGYGNLADLTTGYSKIPDVKPNDEFSHYINTAVNKRIMDIIMEDDYFYPKKGITFAEACTVMVRTLGYYTLESKELRNGFYINKAKELGIIKDLNLHPDDIITIGDLSIMLEGLLSAEIVKGTEKKFHEQSGLYIEVLILNNSGTKENLIDNQVETDKGVYYIDFDKNALELGNRYRVKIKDDEILKIYSRLKKLDSFVVGDEIDSTKLPKNISYYFNGEQKNYEGIKSSLMKSSTILLAYNDEGTGYEYGVIYDPIYSEPVIAKSNGAFIEIGDIKINNIIIDNNGQVIDMNQIKDGDVVYEIKDILNRSSYVLAMDERIEGQVTGIELNYINLKIIEVDNKKYELNNSVDIKKVLNINIGDKVALLLDHNGKVLAVNKIQYKSGPFVQCIVTGNNRTTNRVGEEQVLTNLGVFFFLPGIDLEVGSTYKAVIDENLIVKEEKVEKDINRITIEKYQDNVATYLNSGKKKKMVLPKLQAYYHDGVKIEYNNLREIVKNQSQIILVRINENSGYEYGIIIDPIYNYSDIISNAKGNVEIKECIITGNHLTMDSLAKNQVLTTEGTYYHLSNINLHLSSKYRIITDADTIVKVERVQRESKSFVVERFLEDTILYNDGAAMQKLILPRLSTYYYQGEKVDNSLLKNIIKVNSTIVLVQNEYSTGYDYGVVFDPRYSDPKINGSEQYVFDSRYNFKDVLYTVTDIYGNNSKTIDIDNKVTGQITALLPNKSYPTAIQVGGKSYEISKYYDYTKNIYLNVGSRVTLILGYDGKIVDIY